MSNSDHSVLLSGALRADFSRSGDRFGHVISAFDGDEWIPILESVEGAPDDAWPISPPWQELKCEVSANGQRCLLLVGMAGKSHWSLSVESEPATDSLRFDVACRVRTPPGPLASTYRLLTPGQHQSECMVIRVGQQVVRLKAEIPTGNGECATIRADDRHVAVCPLVTTPSVPQTIRWKYCVDLA